MGNSCSSDKSQSQTRVEKKEEETGTMANTDRQTTFPDELNSDKVNPKSLLKKYLTPELFEQLKDQKTSKGSTLWDCIRSGVINLDSSCGVYAGDEECYRVFAPLLDRIIEDYHTPYKLADGHSSSMNSEEVQYPDLDPERKFIRSTRVRVARNLAGYGLPPTVTKEERLEIEKKVSDLLNSLTGDLAGQYYPLLGMDKETQERLIKEHFLFKEGDRFMEAAGFTREWPEGRGIFYNNEKTFLVWVNEEDHLRIISMEQGGNISSVFDRLCRVVNQLDKAIGFQRLDSHGYLASCPTNLGTGMRASVHVKIPNATNHPDYQKVLQEHHIQARGIHGEHSVSTGEDVGVYDISNARRLGLSEAQCVRDMCEGVKKLLAMEQEKGS